MFSYKFGVGLIAAVFIIWGLHTVFFPSVMVVPHAVYKYGKPFAEVIPRDASRIYGFHGLLMGIGILALVFYPDKRN